MLHPAQIAGKERSRNRVMPAADVMRILTLALMALALALSGMATAMPLTKAPGGAVFVICADGGSATVTLDQNGNPVAPEKDCANCPNCLAPAALFVPPARDLPQRFAICRPERKAADTLTLPGRPHLRPETRGPPPAARERLDMALTGKTADIATKDGHGMPRFRGRTQPAART